MTYDEFVELVAELDLSDFDRMYVERARHYLDQGLIIPESIRAQLAHLWTTAKPRVCVRLGDKGTCRWLSQLEFHKAIQCPFYSRGFDPTQCHKHSFEK